MERQEFESSFKSRLRNLKLADALGNLSIQVDRKEFKKFKRSGYYKIYKKHYPGEIVTGSLALKLYGLIERDAVDIDIIDSMMRTTELQRSGYTFEPPKGYRGSNKHKIGFIFTDWIYVDLFDSSNNKFIHYEDIVVDDPINIIETKYRLYLGREGNHLKHKEDILEIFRKFKV